MPYEKTYDLLDLAILMQSTREGISLQDIMAHFNVSRRTAERMRDLICNRFISAEEVETDDRKKRWRIPQGTLKDIIQFSADDLSCLNIAKEALEKSHMHDKSLELENIIIKIKACIKSDTFRKIEPDAEELTRAEGIACRPGPKIKIKPEIMENLRLAILSCHQIQITYVRKKTKKTDIIILNPYGFLYGDRNHYLVAVHPESGTEAEPHNFIMLNIKNVKILPTTFIYSKNFSLKKYAERSFGVFQEKPQEIEWLFDKKVAEEASHYIFHPTQTMIKNKDGSLTVKFVAGGLMEMDWHLYTWGKHVTVIKGERK